MSPSSSSLVGRDLLSVADLSADEVRRVYATAATLKAEFRATRRHAVLPLPGRTLAMLFQKPSLRTRVTFEAGMAQLGGHAIYLTNDAVLGARESVRDVARNLERVVDAIMVRTGPHEVAVELAAQADIPVINGLTLREHPCQALADLFTIQERFGRLDGLVARLRRRRQQRLSLAGAARRGPRDGGTPGASARLRARTIGSWRAPASWRPPRADGCRSATTRTRRSAAHRWSTPTPGRRWARRPRPRSVATPSPATRSTTRCSTPPGPDVVAMHCLPAHRGEEITSAVMDGPRSLIWEQSENRLHVQKGLLVELLGGEVPA